MGLLSTELPCTFLEQTGIASLRFLGNSPGYLNSQFILIGFVILPMSLQGYMIIETEGKPPCALHMVVSIFWVYISISFNPLGKSLSRLNLFELAPIIGKLLLHLQIHTLCG